MLCIQIPTYQGCVTNYFEAPFPVSSDWFIVNQFLDGRYVCNFAATLCLIPKQGPDSCVNLLRTNQNVQTYSSNQLAIPGILQRHVRHGLSPVPVSKTQWSWSRNWFPRFLLCPPHAEPSISQFTLEQLTQSIFCLPHAVVSPYSRFHNLTITVHQVT